MTSGRALLEQFAPDLEAEAARRHLDEFCGLTDPRYERARHTATLCERLEAVERGDLDRLLVCLPPRHSKTYHVSERFPAWAIGRRPTRQIILASYGAELAEGNSRRARNLLLHPAWPFQARLAQDSTAVNRWHTSDGGVVIAAGVGGAITGFGADLLLIDDPVKGRQEADSELVREHQWAWYADVARTRLMPGAAIILTLTRWHEDDLAGRILNGPGANQWETLILPALAEADDPLGRAPDEPLWPSWYDVEALAALRNEIGARSWSALFQQRPAPAGGALFKRDWWRWYEPALLRHQGLKASFIAVDTASKTGLHNDYSVAAVWGELHGLYYLLDLWRDRVEYPQLKQALYDLADKWHAPLLIEDAGSGTALIQELRRPQYRPGGDVIPALRVLPFKTNGESKLARATLVTPTVEAGLVHLPREARWVDDFIEEHAAFPAGAHDDRVDTTSMALARLAETPNSDTDPVAALYRTPLSVRMAGLPRRRGW